MISQYSYCLNNPLIYTDPSGETFGLVDFCKEFAHEFKKLKKLPQDGKKRRKKPAIRFEMEKPTGQLSLFY